MEEIPRRTSPAAPLPSPFFLHFVCGGGNTRDFRLPEEGGESSPLCCGNFIESYSVSMFPQT